MVIGLTGLTMFFVAGGEPDPPRRDRLRRPRRASSLVGLRALPAGPDPDLARPVVGPARDRLPHDPGPARARARRDPRGRARREPARRRAVPAERQQRLHLRDHRRGVRADRGRDRRSSCSSPWPTLGIRVSLAAPDTFGALLAAGITAWLCIQAFINIGVVVALIPVTGITLPFISAGGSSLTISLAAVGILLSISRETVERGTWNDAAADRRRAGRAGTSTRHSPWPARSASVAIDRPRLISSGSAVIAGSRPSWSRDAGIRCPAARASLTPDGRPLGQHRARSDPARAVRPAGRGDPRAPSGRRRS